MVQGWGLVLAGFGNLPGEMAFHDCNKDGTYPLAVSTRSAPAAGLNNACYGQCLADTAAKGVLVRSSMLVLL